MSYSVNLEEFDKELNRLAVKVSSVLGREIEKNDILFSLFKLYQEELDLSYIVEVWGAFDEMSKIEEKLLSNLWIFDYIELEFNLEDHGLGPFIEKKQLVKVKNSLWLIHKTDLDPFPSSPHLHSKDSNQKLNPRTGELFYKKKVVKKLSKKHLASIQNELKKRKIDF